MDGGEEPGRVLDEAGENELEAGLVVLGRDTEGLGDAPQTRPCFSDGDVQNGAEPNTC